MSLASFPRSATLALGGWLALATAAVAADRPAEEIIKEYNDVKMPTFDPKKQDQEGIEKFRTEMMKAQNRRAELAQELYRSHPDHEQVPKLLLVRWQVRGNDPSAIDETIAEIDKALPKFKNEKLALDACFLKTAMVFRKNMDKPADILPAAEEFIRRAPKDPRGAMILNAIAMQSDDNELKTKLFKRMMADYPDAPATKMAQGALKLLESVGKPFELAFSDAIKGSSVSIKGLKGKVVVVDFWATWCGPCVAELPNMKKLYAEYRDQGVEFIGVSLDQSKEDGGLTKLKEFVDKHEITWPQYYQGKGWQSEFSSGLGINAIPRVFLVDAEGNLANVDARGKLESLIPEYLAKAKKTSDIK
jgi:thiol-disulfide isomerase/thioredoxin